MKNILKSTLVALAVGSLAVTSCDFGDFGDINISPNSPSQPNTGMFFTYAARYVRNFNMNSSTYDPWMQLWTGYIAQTSNNQYNSILTSYFSYSGYYNGCVKQLNEIIKLNSDDATKNASYVVEFGDNANQIAASMTLRAFVVMTLADIIGPLPYSEAFRGESDGIWEPKYDSVKEIYETLDAELNEAYKLFDTSKKLSKQDILFNGDMNKWKKFNATVRMLMAIKLQDVEPATGKARFAKAFADGGMTTAADSFVYKYDSKGASSWFYSIGSMAYSARNGYFAPHEKIVESLKAYQDPRMFTYFQLKGGYMPDVEGDKEDFNAYKGIPLGFDSNDGVLTAAVGACGVAQKYCDQEATYGLVTAARCLLIEAEAAALGWINVDPAKLYADGIKASFDFEKMTDASWNADADAYIAAHPLPSDPKEAVAEIVMQRYLAGFLTDGVESWSDWRIHNIPSLPLTEYQIMKANGEKAYPYRLPYPTSEGDTNKEQYEKCINDNFGGKDSRWVRLWWDVADND